MLEIVTRVDADPSEAQGIKEALAMWLERYGDARVATVTALEPEQMRIGEGVPPWSGRKQK